MNLIVSIILITVACATAFVLHSPNAMRRAAAWLMAHALYVETVDAAKVDARKQARKYRARRMVEFGVTNGQIQQLAEGD